jgi:hypothetical protein
MNVADIAQMVGESFIAIKSVEISNLVLLLNLSMNGTFASSGVAQIMIPS